MSFRYFALLACLLASVPATQAGDPAAVEKHGTRVVQLTLHPAAESLPALKYQLLPSFYDRRRGNAAPLYAKAAMQLGKADERDKRRRELLDGPLENCTPEATADLLHPEVLNLIRLASLRDHCDWELPIREQSFIALLLPEAQETNRLGMVVALQARAQIAAGKFDEAIATLRIAYAMAQHAAESPTLVNGLIGLAVQGWADRALLDLVQRPGAPNVYWALSVLPHPLIDPRPGIEGEMHMLDFSIDGWHEMAFEIPTDAQCAEIIGVYAGLMDIANPASDAAPAAQELASDIAAALDVATKKSEITEYLVTSGMPRERVENLSNLQLAILFTRRKYDELRDQTFRWMALPYPQAVAGLAAADERLRKAKDSREELLPLGSLLLPAVMQVRLTHARGERRIDVLRLLEALRMHAATHDGKLPNTLDEIQTATPLPADAVTGRPFDYKLDGKKAIVTLANEKLDAGSGTLVYEITMTPQ